MPEPPIAAPPIGSPQRPTSAQRALWFVDRLHPGSSAYVVPNALRLEGDLRADILRRTVNEIVRRHEPLRTTFPEVDGGPVAAVASESEAPIPLTDLGALSPDERESELQSVIGREAAIGFDLGRGPLFRARLVRLAEDCHVLLTSTHHIVSDGWSRSVFNREFTAIYDAFAQGCESPLPPVAVPFSALAANEERWLASDEAQLEFEYWKKRLAGVPPLLALPCDHPRPPFQNLLHGDRHSLDLPEETLRRLAQAAKGARTTRFRTLLAGFVALLHRYTGRADIVVGIPVAGHGRKEMPELLGLFVNTVVLRAEVSPELSYGDLLKRVGDALTDALDHERLPFNRLVDALRPEPDLGRNPIYQIDFNGFRFDDRPARVHGLEVTPVPLLPAGSQFDLGLFIESTSERLGITFNYNTDLFAPDTIARMAGHYRALLEGALADPGRAVADLPMLTEAECVQIGKWNDTATGQPSDLCVGQMVEAQARLTPDAVAVECGTEKLTYRELDDRADRLANRLRGMGVGPEGIVAVCMERSLELVVALLGTWKAGGAYLPLEASYPAERLAFMLEDARADVVLAQDRLVSALPPTTARILRLDTEWESIAAENAAPAEESATPENLAYVIYTSGSTGRPKGVAIEHRAIANHMLWMKAQWPLSGADAVIQKAPVSADASVWEFWGPLASGARLVLAGPDDVRDPARLVEVIRTHRVTVLQAVPSYLSALLDEPGFAKCTALRLVFAGGEPLTPELHSRFLRSHPAPLCNLYGPTETTIDATFWISDGDPGRQTIPIGRPVANTTVHILDGSLNQVPVGVPGELHIGGAGLARGYLGRPELTAQKFIPSPFLPGERLYKSGDLAKRLPDGTVEFLGRLDHQLKLRGFRFEPGEVEAALAGHPAVRQSVATLREDEPGNRLLVAYATPNPGCGVTADELRESARRILPGFMVPSAIVVLESFPLTPNGKIDRHSLPMPRRPKPRMESVAGLSSEAERLAQIWSEILGGIPIGADANFFELGGHSLVATKVVSRTRAAFGSDVSVADLFRNPTLAGFARLVAERRIRREPSDDSDAEFSENATLHELFEQQAASTPNAAAVALDDRILTYRELNALSNRIAHRLRPSISRAGDPIGIVADRSPEALAGVLGVLKAGGACLPLDPCYPPERLSLMLSESRTRVLLSRGPNPSPPPQIACIDLDAEDFLGFSEEDPGPSAQATDPAYVLYTSGSTGTPKGVVMPHRPLCNLIAWQTRRSALAPGARTLQFASLNFDVSFQEIFATLTSGGTLVLIPDALRRDPEELLRVVARQSINRLFLPMVAFEQLAAAFGNGDTTLPGLLEVIVAGEQLRITDVVRRMFSRLAHCRLDNQYGPTETHVVTAHRLAGDPAEWPALPPIGRPIANARVLLLDDIRQPVAEGATGELFVGGTPLADGYLHRPDLTAEKFGPSPTGERLYRTGDLARRLPDGSLVFQGRVDHQVKLRGFRVELGEVEATLDRHPDVQQTVAIVREDTPGNRQLVAYARPVVGRSVSVGDLGETARRILPEFMVPSAFVVLESFPLTPNGKIDRLRLPAPEHTEQGEDFVLPRTDDETELAQIWSGILGGVPVGADANFFELGGHSLIAVKVVSRARAAFGSDVSVADLFGNPTLSGFAEVVAAKRTGAGPRDETPFAASVPDCLPLSPGQESLWFLEKLYPSAIYNVPYFWRMRGALDAATLERAFRELVRRHESLRTVYPEVDGAAVQTVVPDADFQLRTIDLRDLPKPERERELMRLASEEAKRPFDLATGPVMRATLARLDREEHALLLCLHHIVIDMWAMEILLRELAILYRAFSEERPSPLPDLPMQYAQFAHQQRSPEQEATISHQLEYWRRKLSGRSFSLGLPTDRPRPAMLSPEGGTCAATLPSALAPPLEALAREESASLFMTLLAAYCALLHRYTAQDDLLVASPVSRRNRVETESLVGFCLNTLAFSADFAGRPTFRELLRQVRDTALEAFSNQEVPIERLVEDLRPSRERGQNPLFQTMFVLTHRHERDALELPGMEVKPVRLGTDTAKIDLLLSVERTEEGLDAEFEFSADLFDVSTVRRMMGHFENLLVGIAGNPDTPVSRLPLLADAERSQVVEEFNRTGAAYPRDETVDALFASQAARTPDARAVQFGGRSMTYRELDEYADRVAHFLLARGVRPGRRVGVCAGRTLENVVATIGILKAGAAYVPLDADSPRERLAGMLGDAGVPLVFTVAETERHFEGLAVPTLPLDTRWDEVLGTSSTGSLPVRDGGAPAYVMYTSGSTGKPKGVVIPHRAISRLVLNTNYLRLGPDDVVANASNVAFDASTLEIWGALLNGGTLHGLARDTILDHARLAEEISSAGITTLFLTTALFNQIARDAPGTFRGLRNMLFGGEAADPDAVRMVLGSDPPGNLVNGYGPTESTTFAAAFAAREVPPGAASLPIGRPLANTRLYILDRSMQPMPIGVPGELFIGGDGLAIEYLNDPELTAARFVTDSEGRRLYRTGDLARWRPDGNVEFVGRLDDQVKIRGFRIEPGEIEAVLAGHPAIRDRAVVALDAPAGGKRLVAYLVAARAGGIDTADVNAYCRERLPGYMVPSAFVVLDALPVTANGKLDRRALPTPDPARRVAESHPELAIHHKLAAIWRDLLNVSEVGIDDSFFDIGGHSLLCVKMLRRVEAVCGKRVSIATLFRNPTIRALAENLDDGSGEAEAIAVHAGGSRTPVFFLYLMGPDFCYEVSRNLGTDRPFYVLPRLREETWLTSPIEDEAAAQIEVLRKAVPAGPYVLAGYCAGAWVAHAMARQLAAEGEQVEMLVLVETATPHARWVRLTRRIVETLAPLFGLAPAQWLALFSLLSRVGGGWQGVVTGIRDSSRWRTLRGRVARRMKSARRRHGGAAAPDISESLADSFLELLWRQAGYRVGRYDGPMHVFVSQEQRKTEQRIVRDWSHMAPGVAVSRIPGDHSTCVNVHFSEFSEALRRVLDGTGEV